MGLTRIDSERLYLRPFRPEDLDAILEYHSDPEVVRYIPWPVRDRHQTAEWLQRTLGQLAFEKEGDYITLAIVRKSDDQLLGQVNAMFRSLLNQRAEIGYVINPRFSRQGYATEATGALVTALFATNHFHRITAHLDVRNVTSAALLERLGFRREAHFKEEEFFKDEWTSTYEYAVLKSEWEAR